MPLAETFSSRLMRMWSSLRRSIEWREVMATFLAVLPCITLLGVYCLSRAPDLCRYMEAVSHARTTRRYRLCRVPCCIRLHDEPYCRSQVRRQRLGLHRDSPCRSDLRGAHDLLGVHFPGCRVANPGIRLQAGASRRRDQG